MPSSRYYNSDNDDNTNERRRCVFGFVGLSFYNLHGDGGNPAVGRDAGDIKV